MNNPIKIQDLQVADLPSTFKLKKKHKEEVFLKYKELNEALFKVGYIPVTFSDFVHTLIETGVKGFSVEEYVNAQLNS